MRFAALGLTALLVAASASACGTDGPKAAVPGPVASLDTRGPVLLIPGYGGGTSPLQALAATLQTQGITAEFVDIGDGTDDLSVYAERVVARSQQLVAAGSPSVDLIGFSAGGVIARIAGTSASGAPLIRRIATIGTPNEGTQTAALGSLIGQCPIACQQLEPGSSLLSDLQPASSPERYLTVWSKSDDVIQPPESSELDNASQVVVQDLCDRIVGHNAVMSDPVTLTSVPAFLSGTALPTSCPG